MIEVKLDKISKDRYKEICAWSKEQLGHPAIWIKQLDVEGGACWFVSNKTSLKEWNEEKEGSATFTFKNDKDATMFSLRWSS